MNKLHLAVQEQMIPGDSLIEKFDLVRDLGYEAIEVRGRKDHQLRDRLPELRAAKAAGVVMPTDCVEMPHFIGAFDRELGRDAVDNLKTQLDVMAEIGGEGACVVTPAAWGMFSRRLPPHEPPRDKAGDHEVLLESLRELGQHARSVGALLLLEPLNRYEDHMVNTLSDASKLVREAKTGGLGIVADTFHMNIEEPHFDDAIWSNKDHIKHVQLGDSKRLQPGTGHLDWQTVLKALNETRYDGYMALECQLDGDPVQALANAARFMREQWDQATAA
jgi:sugar phosphate isomerase/epimerase